MLPTGVVTFLMTDIVGSTPIWERAPHQMDVALQRHDALIDLAVAEHRGFTLRHRGEGDSTFSVFQSAADALAAANDAQQRLATEPWPSAAPIVVRMGLHSGEPLIRSGEYHGRVVNRAARVRSLAAGGQVLVSGATASLVADQIPDGTELHFLRMAVLRGIDEAEAIHELVDPRRARPPDTLSDDGGVDQLPHLPAAVGAAVPRVFSGRAALVDAIDVARGDSAARGRTVLLAGEPGAGKTALAAVAATRAHDHGWQVIAGVCDEAGGVPFGAIREVVATAVEHAPRSVLAEHVMAHGSALARLTDRLVARLGAIGPEASANLDTTRRLLTDAVTDLLRRLAEHRPVALLVDDLQWADHNTLHLLQQIATAALPGVMLLGTYREGHAGVDAFGAWLAGVVRTPEATVLEVRGFDHAQTLQFIEALAGHHLGDDGERLAHHLTAETGGNPFLSVEVLRLLVQQGTIGTDDQGRWHLVGDLAEIASQPSAGAVVAERLGRLGADSTRVLEAGAVVGRSFDPRVIGDMLHLDELEVLDALEPALRSSLVRELGPGEFQFGHALVQHTLYDTIGTTRRGALHRRAAVAIVAAHADAAVASVVAGHWIRTGRADDHEVHTWCRRAGTDAMAALAPEDAVRWFERALAAAHDDSARLDLMVELGKAQRWLDGTSFRSTLLAAASLAEQIGDRDALIRAALANHRGGASRAGTVDTERVAVLERALSAAGSTDSSDRALLLATIAVERSQGNEIDRSIALADEALDVARRVGDDDTLFLVLLRITEAIRIPSTLDRRLRATQELFDIALRLDDPVQLGFAAVREIRTKFEAAQFDQVDRAFTVLDAVGHLDPFVHHNRSSLQAVRAQFAGDLEAALAHAEQARDLGSAETDAAAVYLSTTSMIRWDLGTLGELLPALDRICREYPGVVGFQPTAGLAHVAVGDRDAASAILRAASEQQFEHLPLNPLWAMTVSVFASLCIELHDETAAVQLYELMVPLRGRANISVVSGNGLVDESLTGLAVVAGRADAARRHAHDALALAERVGAPLSLARTHLALGRLARSEADESTASEHARLASNIATRHGMTVVAAQAAALIA